MIQPENTEQTVTGQADDDTQTGTNDEAGDGTNDNEGEQNNEGNEDPVDETETPPVDDNQQGDNNDADDQGNNQQDPNGSDDSDNSDDELSDYPFLSSEAPSSLSSSEKVLLASLTDFSFAFASKVSQLKGEESYIVSPVSLAYLLGMLSEGATGETRKEILSALGFKDDAQLSLNEFCRDLMVLSSKAAGKDEVLEIANAGVLNSGFQLLESYKESVKNYYDASAVNMDFVSEDVVGYINRWSSRHTHERIKEVIDYVDPLSRAVFMNALYFKASWAICFDKAATRNASFTTENGVSRTVPMMLHKDQYSSFRYADMGTFKAVKLSYGTPIYEREGNYSMTILLPSEGVTVDNVLSGLDADKWSMLQSSFTRRAVDLQIPRFEASFNGNLNDLLIELGVKSMFNNADFSRMSQEPLFISIVKQVANITVDESGTEAAAVTIASMDMEGPSGETPDFVVFHADHPFLFAITENTTGAILFMGCYKE